MPYTGHIQRVKDGDTVVVSLDGGGAVDVRLWGIDAPETSQPYGPAATKAAQKIASGQPCRLRALDRDRYGRVVGRVVAGGVNLGRSLVKSGYAWHDRRYAPGASRLHELEREARAEAKGLWTQANPTPPWDWRAGSSSRKTKQALRGLATVLAWGVGTLLFFAVLVLLSV
mgnify:CR=1 FL=1